MRGKLISVLFIIFLLSFCSTGGLAVLSNIKPYISDSNLPSISTDNGNIIFFKTAWEKTYRMLTLKSAVEAKLNKKNWVKLQDMPLTLQQAIIAVEDNRFYHHLGIDIEGIMRATLVNIQSGEISEGASTITQQLAKNMFLTSEQSYGRKIEEALLAINFELNYSKESILEMYLNTIYFGSGTYGIADAANIYFGKKPSELNLPECAMLAGIPNAPSLISPYVDFTAAKQRQAVVLNAMVRSGFIGSNQAAEAKQASIRLKK